MSFTKIFSVDFRRTNFRPQIPRLAATGYKSVMEHESYIVMGVDPQK